MDGTRRGSATPGVDRRVDIRLLGRFEARLPDGSEARWERPSARRLVAVLALAPGRRLRRDVLADALFPDLGADTAGRSLAKALSMARAAIERPVGRPVFAADRAMIGLRRDAVHVDLDAVIERLETAARMPDAELLATFVDGHVERYSLLDDDPYEDWAVDARERLEQARVGALVAVANAMVRCAWEPRARSEAWRAVTDVDPANEAAWLGRIRADLESDRPDLALRASYEARAAIRDSLGTEPGPGLDEVHRALLAASRRAENRMPASERPTFGRGSMTTRIDELLLDLQRGRPRDATLVGPAGIGKSHLLDVAADRARSFGIVVGRGASVPEDGRVPFASLRQALRGLPLERISLRPRVGRLVGRSDGDAGPAPIRTARDQALLSEELADALTQLSQDQPILVVLDDVHWVDPALRTVLVRLVAHRDRGRWSVLSAARSDDPEASIFAGIGHVLSVPPLDDAAIEDLVRSTVSEPSDAVVAMAVRWSAGNALFAEELARAGEDAFAEGGALPDRIMSTFMRRLQRRTPGARRILPVLALGDAIVRSDVLVAMLGDETEVLDALDELVSASLIRRVPGGVQLAHPLIRQAAAELVNPIRRARIHRQYADALDGLALELPDVTLSAIRHRIAAWESARLRSDVVPAVHAALRGARITDEEFSAEATRDLLSVALRAWEDMAAADPRVARGDIVAAHVRLGELSLDAGDEPAAMAHFDLAATVAATDDDRAMVWSARGGAPYRRGDLHGAIGAYRQGLATLADQGGLAAARLRSDLGWAMARLGDPAAEQLLRSSADDLTDRAAPEIAARALDRFATTTSDIDLALEASDRAFGQLRRGSDRRELAVLLVHRAGIERRAGRMAAALRSSDEALALCQAAGEPYMESVALWTRAEILDASGDLPGALAARDREAALLEEIGNELNLAGCHRHRASLLERMGRSDGGARSADGASAGGGTGSHGTVA